MNVVGCLVFWDESPHWLANCVSGFARVCDTIVAVDGAYALMPGGRARSHPDQAYAIQDACEAHDTGCIIHRPQTVWVGNEIEKRQQSIKLAGTLDPDWVWVFDSDYLLMKLDNPEHVRSLLENSEHNVAHYSILDTKDHLADEEAAQHVVDNYIDHEFIFKDRAIFRYTEDLEYGPAHYHVKGTYDGELQWLRGPDAEAKYGAMAAEAEDLLDNFVVLHRRTARSKVRNRAAAGFAALRDRVGAEEFDADEMFGGAVVDRVTV